MEPSTGPGHLAPRKYILVFSYKFTGPPVPAVPVVDCRVLPNPYSLGATPEARRALVRQLSGYESLVKKAVTLLALHPTIAIGCAWGKDRSRAVAEGVAALTGAEIREYH